MKFIKNLEKCINYNNKIIKNYSEDCDKNENYKNLLKLSSSIEDIYEEKIKEFDLIKNEIKNIYKLGIKDLKDNYLDDFNKKYDGKLEKDRYYVGFRNTGLLELNKLDEVKFKELCRINDFNRIGELELKFEDNINIDTLIKMPYVKLTFLGLLGRIKDIGILSKLPFKSLQTLFLSNNNFYNTNIDIFRNVPFHNLQRLILCSNKINNIEGLSLITLELNNNCINDLKSLKLLPFQKLENLNLEINCIEKIDFLSNAPFPNLKLLDLSGNKITDINPLSKAKFNNLQSLILSHNQIKNIDVFSKVPFIHLGLLDLRNNTIENISVFNKVPFIHLRELYLSHNYIRFDILTNCPFNSFENISIFVDGYQNHRIQLNRERILNNLKIRINIHE